jgi:hypothetical protein
MMKKILASAVFIGFCFSLSAQTFDFGIKGGINSSKIITGSNTGTNSYTLSDLRSDVKTGYNIGAFMRLGGKRLYLQPEILYTVKKANNEMNLIGNQTFAIPASSQSFNLKSVQVPLLLGCKLINLKIVSLRVFTGPAMSVILDNSEIKLTNSGSVIVDPSVYDPKNFKSNVWDWQAGGGIDVGNLVFDVRYEWGLTNVSDLNPQTISFNNKGNTLTFSVGFKFL